MNKSIQAIAKINLKNLKVPYLITGICIGAIVANLIVDIALAEKGIIVDNIMVSIGLYFYLLVLLAPIFIPARNFRRIFNLGGKRSGFFWGSLSVYVLLAVIVSLLNAVIFYTFEKLIVDNVNGIVGVINLLEVFGWSANGVVIAFFQQFAFLFWITAFIHTLTAAQDKWYGWAADLMIIIILSVFIPIAPLRKGVVFFFYMIIFSHPAAQIASCLILALAIYALNKPIFARKAM